MRREDHPRQLPQRRVRRQRLDREHIDRRSGDALRPDRLCERRFIHQLAARRVDEHRGAFHEGQAFGVDQMVRLLGVRDVQRDDVGLLQQLLQRQQLDLELGRALGREVRIVSHDLHPERPGQLADVTADAPQSHDSDRLAAELGAFEPLAIPLPAPHRLGRPGDVPYQAEQQPHGVLGRAHRIRPRRVHHGDAAPRRGRNIDVVHAGTRACDHPEARGAREQVGSDPRLAAHDQGVRPGKRPLQLFPRLPGEARHLDVRRGGEQLQPAFRHAIGDHHAERHATSPSSWASSSSSAPTV